MKILNITNFIGNGIYIYNSNTGQINFYCYNNDIKEINNKKLNKNEHWLQIYKSIE